MAERNNEEEERTVNINSAFYAEGYPEKPEVGILLVDMGRITDTWGVGGVLAGIGCFCGTIADILKEIKPDELALIENYSQLSKALEGFVNQQIEKWKVVKKETSES